MHGGMPNRNAIAYMYGGVLDSNTDADCVTDYDTNTDSYRGRLPH
jgi:hypothetical protein